MNCTVNEVSFPSSFIPFQEVQVGWMVLMSSNCVGLCVMVWVLWSGMLCREAADPPSPDLPPTLSHLTPPALGVGWGWGNPIFWKTAFKIFGTKGREPESKITLFFWNISLAIVPIKQSPFIRGSLKHFFPPPLFCFEISWATINFRERERKIIQQGSITTLSFYCCNENLFPFPFVSHII